MRKIRISGVGCCLMDCIYDHVDFQSDTFRKYLSKKSGDGGLKPGKLTFEEDLERFAGASFPSNILPMLTLGRKPQKENIGGPCIVALINAAQMAWRDSTVSFYGCRGDDEVGENLLKKLNLTNLDLSHFRVQKGRETASTSVLSDPNYDNGHGERTFVNTIGASWNYFPQELDDNFFNSDICVFGGTALVPHIHQGLSVLLRKAKTRGSITVVNTVYDFLSEKSHPRRRWPMGDGDRSYRYIDLLLVDHEEAFRLSGEKDTSAAIAFFRNKGTGAVIVTNGAHDVSLWADSPILGKVSEQTMPVSAAVGEAIKSGCIRGDSTGCGDNFAGGVIASLAKQMLVNRNPWGEMVIDLKEACRWGIVSGGFACFYYGGTYFEKLPGEKLSYLDVLYDQYLVQK